MWQEGSGVEYLKEERQDWDIDANLPAGERDRELEEGQWRCAMCRLVKRFSDSKWSYEGWDGICTSCLRKVES